MDVITNVTEPLLNCQPLPEDVSSNHLYMVLACLTWNVLVVITDGKGNTVI